MSDSQFKNFKLKMMKLKWEINFCELIEWNRKSDLL